MYLYSWRVRRELGLQALVFLAQILHSGQISTIVIRAHE